MKNLYKVAATAVAGLLMLSAMPLLAHGGHNNLIQLRAEPGHLYLETHLNASTLTSFDTNQDGKLTQTEFDQQLPAIKQWLQAYFSVSNAAGERLTPNLFDLPISESETGKQGEIRISHIHLIQQYAWATAPLLKVTLKPLESGKQLLLFKEDGFFMKPLGDTPLELTVNAPAQ
ncbi:MAG: hypothetical protein L3K52_01205 [Candidatus Thiothrix sulfatifontis]|nr:MAG: hypothetical protein L3K52_01205 [Candidatus Thiothrix sulfatifontis]